MDWSDHIHCFDFKNDRFADDDIKPVTALQFETFGNDRQWNLPLKGNLPQFEFPAQALFVSAFQKSRAENPVNFNRGSDNDVCQWVVFCHGKLLQRETLLSSVFSVPLWLILFTTESAENTKSTEKLMRHGVEDDVDAHRVGFLF